MYNGIGLSTVRGSGTNGYVQRNTAHIANTRTKVGYLVLVTSVIHYIMFCSQYTTQMDRTKVGYLAFVSNLLTRVTYCTCTLYSRALYSCSHRPGLIDRWSVVNRHIVKLVGSFPDQYAYFNTIISVRLQLQR